MITPFAAMIAVFALSTSGPLLSLDTVLSALQSSQAPNEGSVVAVIIPNVQVGTVEALQGAVNCPRPSG